MEQHQLVIDQFSRNQNINSETKKAIEEIAHILLTNVRENLNKASKIEASIGEDEPKIYFWVDSFEEDLEKVIDVEDAIYSFINSNERLALVKEHIVISIA